MAHSRGPSHMAHAEAPAAGPHAFIGLAATARLCPSIRGGKPVHPATLSRWVLKGVRLNDGTTLRLAAKRFPGGWATTREDLDEFVDRLTADRCGAPVPAVTPHGGRGASSRTEAALDLLGI